MRGLEFLAEAAEQDQGVLITPNHSSHADPFALLETADQFGAPFYFMTAWQVFGMTHSIGRRILRQHGCFSINREGHDVRAVRCAVDVLATQRQPLVIFPEGEVFHLNDRLMPFRRGAATAALLAARRGRRPVACLPCAIKFQFVGDPTPNLLQLADQLEENLLGRRHSGRPLKRRVLRLIEANVARQETAHLGRPQRGALCERIANLIDILLARLNERYQLPEFFGTVPEQVKRLRFHVIRSHETPGVAAAQRAQHAIDLEHVFHVMQLYSYPIDYLADEPTLERLGETLDKLEEDVLGVPTAGIRGLRRAIVSFAEPIVIQPQAAARNSAEMLTQQLQFAVETLLDQTISAQPYPSTVPAGASSMPLPAFDLVSTPESLNPSCLPAF